MTWHDVLVVVLLMAVAAGIIPVIAGLVQYLLVPVHAVKNHLGAAAPYLPRVVVVVPAWNEGAVLGASLERLMGLEYPPDRLRVYVVDDASTDDTPDVVLAKAAEHPGRIVHLRRAQGGQGKAHTLNHGIERALADDWMEALLIMDADVIYRPDSLRKMTRHLADPQVGAVTAFIREGSGKPGTVSKFIGYEYVTAQAAARRAQNVMGAMACLAGGAQLHARANLEAVGGRIDTTTLAEDTFTTFLTQLDGRTVVFEPAAVVLAEEPDSVVALWKQRVRWARGNVQITRRFTKVWFRRPFSSRGAGHRLSSLTFGAIWFSIYLLPVAMTAAAIGLVGLYFVDHDVARTTFQGMWWVAVVAYVFITSMTLLLDRETARRSWVQGLLFPGIGAIVVMLAAWVPGLWEERVPDLLGMEMSATGVEVLTLVFYAWTVIAMLSAWLVRWVEALPGGKWPSRVLLYVVGFGPVLCAITLDAYAKQWRGASTAWDKTEKTGRVVG
ncbi:glycosyltransferase family 2 protein [Cellulomonas sp. PhB150]|uniref:glycosyltransferase n=1 Tax=Cellulomonas sp. PhB150 TaxID=2485188 RepID=UPI000F48F526|nr:glycosyltransferase [Cellulomonas sp. PhB150]ROS31688.1 cellulose synthase/poly-beta-1,6-N-acetylglucosamine synthase-like glycosyltransferase [Cellulomonas sp. PhB150]